jgi:glycosyltransferase involved in cell wall biosynthesis
MIRVSAVLSIHNRSKLFGRALAGYLWQTMRPEEWEIVLVDDDSTEDLSQAYRPYLGRINLRHVRMSGKRHPMFAGYHTPALSINLGVSLAFGRTICLCHPEILHKPTNFECAAARIEVGEKSFLFGHTLLGTAQTNEILDSATTPWTANGWQNFLDLVRAPILDVHGIACYWFTSFLPREAVVHVGGVDFQYLAGVGGEDDDFKERVKRAGWAPVYTPTEIVGLHQYHGDNKDAWDFKAKAEKEKYDAALNRNRALLYARLGEPRKEFGPAPCGPGFPQPANQWMDWTARESFVSEVCYAVGSDAPFVQEIR